MDHPFPQQPGRTADLVHAYLQAEYLVAVEQRQWRITVGARATELESTLGAASYLFITAWNPLSQDAGVARNMDADQRLQVRLQIAGFLHHPATASDIGGGHREHGWLVLDLPEATADLLARDFSQAGVVYWQRGHRVRLRMQSPPPEPWQGHDRIDWTGQD